MAELVARRIRPEPGNSTAFPYNVRYRTARVSRYVRGRWLDFGCADGGYSEALRRVGATSVVGVDVDPSRVEAARVLHPDVSFRVVGEERVDLPDASFDGVFMNEVFEHVADEDLVLGDVHRLLRPRGLLVLISPNRGFPFEGHGAHIGGWSTGNPVPIIPWLPASMTRNWLRARNYWPRELRDKIAARGFRIVESGFLMPVLEYYRWLPAPLVRGYRRHLDFLDRCPGLRRVGVSNLVVAARES